MDPQVPPLKPHLQGPLSYLHLLSVLLEFPGCDRGSRRGDRGEERRWRRVRWDTNPPATWVVSVGSLILVKRRKKDPESTENTVSLRRDRRRKL